MNKHYLGKLVPSFVKALIIKAVKARGRRILYKTIKERELLQKAALYKLKKKETIKCVFCTFFPSN